MHSLVIALIALAAFDHRFGGGEAGALSLSLQEAASYAVLYLLAVHALVFRHEPSARPRDGVIRMVGLYALWLVAGAMLGALLLSNLDALHGLKDSVPGLVLFAAIVAWVDSEPRLRQVHVGLAVVLVLLGGLALAQFLWGGPYLNRLDPNALFKLDYRGVSLVRHPVVGTVGSPNTNAVFLMPLALLTVGRFAEERRESTGAPSLRWLFLGALICGLAIILTQAKIATALGAATVGLLFLASRLKLRVTPVRAGALFGAMAAAAVLGVVLLACFAPVLPDTFALGTLLQRATLDQSALSLLGERASTALLGGGIASFSDETGGVLGIHNEYLRQCVQAGIPGGVLFTGALFSGMLRRVPRWTYVLPLIALALIFLTESATGNQLQSMVFLTLGLNVASARLDQEARA